jgi:hypothetical protein
MGGFSTGIENGAIEKPDFIVGLLRLLHKGDSAIGYIYMKRSSR